MIVSVVKHSIASSLMLRPDGYERSRSEEIMSAGKRSWTGESGPVNASASDLIRLVSAVAAANSVGVDGKSLIWITL